MKRVRWGGFGASSLGVFICAVACGLAAGADGLRVATWNITFYAGDRATEIGTVLYGQWDGRSMDPDLICLQEMTSRNAVSAFVAAINNAPGSPGDWRAAPVLLSGSLNNALVYRTSKLGLDGFELVSAGSGAPNHPRNVVRYDFRPVGYPEDASIISVFPQHFKAGPTASDGARRAVEARVIADHIATLPDGRAVILGADLNIPSGTDEAYRIINGVVPNTGLLRDPIGRVATWKNNVSYRMIHTQDPTSQAGMDDRYDQVLLSPSLLDGFGMDYDGRAEVPWDLSRFDDPNHSYRAWGNDGTRFNAPLRVAGNEMVGPVIAQAIRDMADPDGHIPVFLDLDMPPRLGLDRTVVDLGVIPVGEESLGLFEIRNAGDTVVWGDGGIAPLRYAFSASADDVGVPSGAFILEATAGAARHTVSVLPSPGSVPGMNEASVLVLSDDPAAPAAEVVVRYTLEGCSSADTDAPIGELNFFDISTFIGWFNSLDGRADLAAPLGVLNFFDVAAYLDAFAQGCP